MREFPVAAERAKLIAQHLVKIPEWASFTSIPNREKKLIWPDLRQCAVLPGHGRSLIPLDPSTISGISDTISYKGMRFSGAQFQYDEIMHKKVLAWGLLLKAELGSHKKILSVFAKHQLPVETILNQYSLDTISILDRTTTQSRVISEEEFVSRLRLEFACIANRESPADGFRILPNPQDFQGSKEREDAVKNFLKELEDEHPFVVAERKMPHNVRLSNISTEFRAQFPKRERQERMVEVLREAVSQFPWTDFPLFSNLPAIVSISEQTQKSDAEFLTWYAQDFVPTVLGTYLRTLHSFATHGWVTPQNITIVGIPTDLDSVHGPEITGDPIDPRRVEKDYSDALHSLYHLCDSVSRTSEKAARANFDKAYKGA